MYLSRMELDLTRRDAVRALASPALLHGALEACFPGERRRWETGKGLRPYHGGAAERLASGTLRKKRFLAGFRGL